jgi:hypothetical protein
MLHKRRRKKKEKKKEMDQITAIAPDLPSQQFRIGGVLSKTSHVFFRRPVTFLLITFASLSPLLVAGLLLQTTGRVSYGMLPGAGRQPMQPEDMNLLMTFGWISMFAMIVLGALNSAITLHITLQHMRGASVRLGEAIARGFARFFPLVGMLAIVFVAMVFASILLVVPAFILLTMWSVANPVCVYERLGPVRSLGRSRSLTKGFRWKLFWLFILFILANVVLTGFQFLGAQQQAGVVVTVIGAVGKYTLISLYNIGTAVAYYDLKVVKEGVDIEGVAAVFD